MDENLGTNWPVKAQSPPNLRSNQWLLASILGVVFLVLALTQLFSFRDFSNNFNVIGYGPPNTWAGIVIFTELWAAFGFFKIRLSWGFRAVSNGLAVAVGLFWLFTALRLAAELPDANGSTIFVSNFFGRFLSQTPGWGTVIEATVFLGLVLYAVEAIGQKVSRPAVKVSRHQ